MSNHSISYFEHYPMCQFCGGSHPSAPCVHRPKEEAPTYTVSIDENGQEVDTLVEEPGVMAASELSLDPRNVEIALEGMIETLENDILKDTMRLQQLYMLPQTMRKIMHDEITQLITLNTHLLKIFRGAVTSAEEKETVVETKLKPLSSSVLELDLDR